jgi:nitrate reductase gamma subunit
MAALISLIAVAVLALLAYVGANVDGLRTFFGVILPGAAFVVFVVGIIWRIIKWARSPEPFRIPTTAGQQKTLSWMKHEELDNPSGLLGVLGRMVLEVFAFRSLFRNTTSEILEEKQKVTYMPSKLLWFAAIVFHWSLLLVLFRHLRFFMEPTPVIVEWWQVLDGFMQIGVPAMYLTTIGIAFGLVILLARRLLDGKLRYISLPSDYFALFLLLGIALSGIVMRHLDKTDIIQVKVAIAGLFSGQLAAPVGVGLWYFIHIMLVSALLIYFPFSKLLHMPGIFFSPTRNQANSNRTAHHVNPWNPGLEGHSYKEWEDDFRDKLKASGYVLDEE